MQKYKLTNESKLIRLKSDSYRAFFIQIENFIQKVQNPTISKLQHSY